METSLAVMKELQLAAKSAASKVTMMDTTMENLTVAVLEQTSADCSDPWSVELLVENLDIWLGLLRAAVLVEESVAWLDVVSVVWMDDELVESKVARKGNLRVDSLVSKKAVTMECC